VLCLSVILKPR